MKYFWTICICIMSFSLCAQETTFKIKKGQELYGLFYSKGKEKQYNYLMFSGDEVSVWSSKEKPKNALSNADYKTFSKASIKTTNYTMQDSLVTFEFKNQIKGRYVFLDYHCILEDNGSLHVKISDTNELIEVKRYRLVNGKRK